jgi:hypothetical protein
MKTSTPYSHEEYIKANQIKLRVGDYVRSKTTKETSLIMCIRGDNDNILTKECHGRYTWYSADQLEPWKPTRGEWCMFSDASDNSLEYVLGKYLEYSVTYRKHTAQFYKYKDNFDIVHPLEFIHTLKDDCE